MKKNNKLYLILFWLMQPAWLLAQDKEAHIAINFAEVDSIKTTQVSVTSDGKAVPETEVKLYVERLYSLLPIGDATTDEEGKASVEFPINLPGDEGRNLTVIAKIEDNDVYMNTETKAVINWGKANVERPKTELERSLYAGRAKAPIYFIVTSILLIIGIWGTLFYIVLQLFRLKKLGTVPEKINL